MPRTHKMHGMVDSASVPSPEKEDTRGWDSLASKSVHSSKFRKGFWLKTVICTGLEEDIGCPPLLLPQVHIQIQTHKPRHTYITGMHSWLCIYTQIFLEIAKTIIIQGVGCWEFHSVWNVFCGLLSSCGSIFCPALNHWTVAIKTLTKQ